MSLPIISVAQMHEWERMTWATGQTEQAVIARVGEALARRLMELTHADDGLLLLAGKGHNGDDVRAALPHLAHRRVQHVDVANPRAALNEFNKAVSQQPKLVVDGLFGTGLSRPLDAAWIEFIAKVNDAGIPTVAMDVPSGLNADTGQPQPSAIRATITTTVGAPKRGFFTQEAAEFVGRVEVLSDVGLISCPLQSDLQWTVEQDFEAFPPARRAASHKGTFGHAALVAGSMGYHGASVLAARGAQRARPGLITLFTQPEIYAPVASQLQAVMVHPWNGKLDSSHFTAALFGPGLATPMLTAPVRENFQDIWMTAPVPVVADASALDWLPPGEVRSGSCRVITPHPGEAARLLNCSALDVQRDRAGALRRLANCFENCWVVLKGQHTLIGRADGVLFVNSSGNAGLGQGGTGDLLAGFIAGLLAQPALQADPLRALRFAVWEHGNAADRLSQTRKRWIVEELANELGG
jgi:NAD(P)H-hydrate epimerase